MVIACHLITSSLCLVPGTKQVGAREFLTKQGLRLTTTNELHGTVDAPAPCASTDVLWSCTVCCNKEQTTKEHICVGPSFVIFRHLSLCERSKSSLAQTLQPCPPKQKISLLQMCVLHLSLFSLFDQRRCWIASLY